MDLVSLLRKSWVFYFFLTGVLVICNGGLLVARLTVGIFAPALYRRFVQVIVELWSFFPWVIERESGSRVTVYGDAPPSSDHVLLVANHVEESDWSIIFWLATAAKKIGFLKLFAKSEIRFVPFIGTGMQAMGTVFLSRSWEKDKKTIERTFEHLNGSGTPYWLLSHPEGHRVTQKRLLESQAFARERGLNPLNHVLLPRVKGFAATVLGLQSSLEYVVDVTICWNKSPAAMPLFFVGRGGPRQVHLHLAVFPASQLPHTSEGLQQWLFDRWEAKEKLVATFKEHGHFGDAPRINVAIDKAEVDGRMRLWQSVVAAWTALVAYWMFLR